MTDQPRPSDWMSILALGFVWGGTFMVISLALDGYGPLTVACARTTLGALSLLGLMAATGRPMPRPAPKLWSSIFWIGMFSTAVPFLLLSWGIRLVPSAFAGISMAAVPLFVLPLAHVFSDEKLVMRKFAGVLIGFVGALVLIGPGLATLGQGSEPLAQLACVGAALCYAVSSITTRRCPPIDPITLSALTLAVGSIALIPLMLWVEGVPGWAGAKPGFAILFLGLIPTAAATLLRVRVIRSAGAVFMTLVNYQVPIWAMIFGAVVLSEALPLRFFAALGLILTGLAISQWYSLKRLLTGK
ncbi:DMT family transporter [Aestuariibius sp. HNIBRBA575]|uniref:DMT family transporter n=1 Tax=Aestuariibius sp. HNIBRBA575 TaxID=3233343 RepID=UPI0034A4BCDE